jgi:hypothetical protein
MTRKLAISVPDDVAARLDRESNVSAFITEAVRVRIVAEDVRSALTAAGFVLSDEGIDRAGEELDLLRATVTPELREQAAELRARIARGRPGA